LERLTGKATALRGALADLRRLAALPEAEFAADRDKRAGFRYHVVVAAEAALEIAMHLISRRGWRTPAGYKDTFTVLVEEGILAADTGTLLRSLAGARNLLVHQYWTVDDLRLRRELEAALPGLDSFLVQIGRAVAATLSVP
jgi:uncharacterized protein YutE (UPF0331/DUF86 family)